MQKADLIRKVAQPGEERANHLARLASRSEIVGALGEVAIFALKRNQALARHWLAVSLDQFRFVIPAIQMAARAGGEDNQQILRARFEVRLAPIA